MVPNSHTTGKKKERGRDSAHQRFRDEIVRLHRQIFRRNRKRIHASVQGYSANFLAYERRYARYVRGYQRRVDGAELDQRVAGAHVVYVGDYHTLPQAREAFSRLLRRTPQERPLTIALELFQGRHQHFIDAFLRGAMDEDALLRHIGYHPHSMLGDWESFKPILELARTRGASVVAIDSSGRGTHRNPLINRDRYAAKRIAKQLNDHPEALLLTLVGELHIAPPHLPTQVRSLMTRNGLRDLIIYQNCEKIYWEIEKKGLEHDVNIVRVAKGQYCLINTPPIVCQQSFLNWLDMDEDMGRLDAPEQNFHEYTQIIATFFDLPIDNALDEVELATVADLSFLERLQRRGDFSASDMRHIRRQILDSQSLYIPRARMVYLGDLSTNHAAEEGTHFLRHVCAGTQSEPRLLVDAFYARCLEEALGFLGSKLINHRRRCATIASFERILRSRNSSARDKQLARFVTMHGRLEEGARVRGMAAVYGCSPDMFNAVTHAVGYRLGNRLYYGLLSGELDKQEVRKLFFKNFAEEGAALTDFLYYNTRVKGVIEPTFF